MTQSALLVLEEHTPCRDCTHCGTGMEGPAERTSLADFET